LYLIPILGMCMAIWANLGISAQPLRKEINAATVERVGIQKSKP